MFFVLPVILGCGSGGQAGSNSESSEPPKPKLVGVWEGDIGLGIKSQFTFTRTGEVLGVNPLTRRNSVMFVVSSVEGDTVILRHISEAHDDDASEGKIEFLGEDKIELWPPSGLQNLKETSYTFSRVPGSAPTLGEPIKLPAEAKRVVGIWETQLKGSAATMQMDFLPDGSLNYGMSFGQSSTGQWNYHGTEDETILIQTGPSDEKMGIARIQFMSNDKMIMTEEDGTNEMTFSRIHTLIE